MAISLTKKFTKADEIEVQQSVGPKTGGDVNLSNILDVFEPHQGRDLIYLNPKFNNGSTEITQSNDRRIPLGTYTLNNRDYWENNNFNESTFQSYLKDNLETHDTLIEETPDGPIVRTADDNIYYSHWLGYSWSIDALPFVINPNTDDIIHLDRYYDKEIDKENYELATEGKINYYLSPRIHGRLGISGSGNIDIFTNRPLRTAGGKNYFEWLITGNSDEAIENLSDNTDGNGMYLFKLNWGDGSELEYTDKPQLLEPTTLFEHFYEKPGFYSITGVVYHIGHSGERLYTWEKFETNILLNPSPNYELNLHDYNNFASIGGISKDSALVKSLYNMIGVDPLYPNGNEGASEEVIKELNEFDKIQILNVVGKVDYSRLNDSLLSIVSPYQGEIDEDDSAILGCTDSAANNYSGLANVDDGSCVYTSTATISIDNIPPGTIGIEIIKDGSVSETLSFSEGDTPQYVEFDRRDNLTITLTNQLQAGLEFPNELTTIEDWFFVGWAFNDEEIAPNTADPNILYESDHGDISDDFTLNARFQYIDETPPLNANDLAVYNHDSDLASFIPTPGYGEVGLMFSPSLSTDVDYYKIELFYTSLDTPIVVDTLIKTATEVATGFMKNFTVSNLTLEYKFKVTTYDTSENFSSTDSDPIIPIVDWTVAPDPLTELSVEQIDRNILRFTWEQIDLSWPGIDGDFGHFELEIWNENGEEYTYNYSGDFATNDIIPNSFDFDASEIGSLFRYTGGGVINDQEFTHDNVNPDNPFSWDARIRVVDGHASGFNTSGPTEMDSIQPSRLIDPFGTVKLSISVNGAHGTISVNDPDEIEPWGAYTILLTPFLNHDIIVSSNFGWLFGDIEPYGNEDDDFTDYIVYDENSHNQTISISELTTDTEGTLRVNWIQLDAQSLILFPNNNSLVFDGYFIEPYVLGEPNEKVEITFDWDLSLVYGANHLTVGEEVQVRLTYIYDWNTISPGYQALAQMFGGEDSIITLEWDENNLSGTETMVVNYVEDGDDLLESFTNFMGTTIYPEAFRLAFWKTSSTGMSPFGTSGTLSGPTVYGSPEIQFNRATLGCTDNTALNYNPNASVLDNSCSYLADFQTVSYETTSTDVVVPSNGNNAYPLFNLTRDSGEGTLSLWYTVGNYYDGSTSGGLTGDYAGSSAAWGTDFYLSNGTGANCPGTNQVGYVTFTPGVLTRTLRLRILGTNTNDRTDSDTLYLHLDGVSHSDDLPVMIAGTTPAGLQDTVKHVVNILPPETEEPTTYELTLRVKSSDDGNGYVTPEGTFTYEQGTEVTIEATPYQEYIFAFWTGNIIPAGGNQYSSQTIITMNGNYTIEANFTSDGN